MRTVRLYGDMGKRFGRVHRLEVASPAEAIRALCATRSGFRAYLQERLDAPFRVLVGGNAVNEQGLRILGGGEIRIVPVVKGAKDGLGQILLGAALIVAAIYMPGLAPMFAQGGALAGLTSAVSAVGWAMALGGVASLLAGTPKMDFGAGVGNSEAETFSFSSPTLTVGQGGCVPLGYGTMRIGGTIISAGVDVQTWQDKGFGGAAPDNAGTRGGDGNTSPWVWAVAP